MTGGTWTFSGAFAVGRGANANGLFTLAGGTVSDSGGQFTVGRSAGVGVFTITSGTFSDSLPTTNQSIAVFIGRDVDTGSVMTVNGGSATVSDILDLAANNGTTGITNGTLTIAGGVTSIGSIAFNGSDYECGFGWGCSSDFGLRRDGLRDPECHRGNIVHRKPHRRRAILP